MIKEMKSVCIRPPLNLAVRRLSVNKIVIDALQALGTCRQFYSVAVKWLSLRYHIHMHNTVLFGLKLWKWKQYIALLCGLIFVLMLVLIFVLILVFVYSLSDNNCVSGESICAVWVQIKLQHSYNSLHHSVVL